MVALTRAQRLAEARQSTIYIDYQNIPVDDDPALAVPLHNFTHGVIDTLARSLIHSSFQRPILPAKQGVGLNRQLFDRHWPVVIRPRIIATAPAGGDQAVARRYYGYNPDDLGEYSHWQWGSTVAHYLKRPIAELRETLVSDPAARVKLGKKDGDIIDIADSYIRPRVFVQDYLSYASRCISSYRMAEAIAVIGNGVIARECALLGVDEQHTPTLELGGLKLQRAGNGRVVAAPCEPGI